MFDSEMHRNCLKRKYLWFREQLWDEDADINPLSYSKEVLDLCKKRPKFNTYKENESLDVDTKKAALKASSSVVALSSYTGEQALNRCCGVIIDNDGSNAYTVLTSAKLVRCHTEENVLEDNLADDLKIIVNMYDGGSHEGQVLAYDFHYNIAWIRFQSDSSIPTARLKQVDDYINVNPAEEKSLYLRPHSSHFNLVPGQAIVAVGRYFAKPFDIMAAPGEFSIDRLDDFDCKELFMGIGTTTECGEGGAVINLSGEVIGIMFHERGCIPFLPINIAHKCWEHYKRYGELRRPYLGIVATNLYAADISHIEKVIHKIPSICNGVLVEKVIRVSSLESAGLRVDDVIVQCGGKTVHSFLEFVEMVWDKKLGDILQLAVVRISEKEPISVNMVVEEVAVGNFYRWPRKWTL